MRALQEAAPSDVDANLATRMFCYSVRKQIAAMIAALDGANLLVFTGGIGEHDAIFRAAICSGHLGAGHQKLLIGRELDRTDTRPHCFQATPRSKRSTLGRLLSSAQDPRYASP